ncbi:hypothetical protein P0082_05900 [Candidatus Haliotispira prima]|uniref:Uncharacterized protein n=1 Tax=Candidatus Haliotispira prima TaxID=3034016 RepID=A0ABY8MK28_9SPIO|nr:hypothetical protein P0082_05900 [Candidatus Haliotispira prima]
MAAEKKLSNPFSTGGGGAHFEAHVQSCYVVLMLTGGYSPCLPCGPISKIKLQGKIDGFHTDDFIVFVKDPNNGEDGEERKLLGQVKHSISITQNSPEFGEVMQAAWSDFNNGKVFTKGKDRIALITGPLSATDTKNVQWLLDQAKRTKDVDEFFRYVEQANFGPSDRSKKLDVIRHHLAAANGGNKISDDELYDFLRHFYLLGYDLGREHGFVLSLLYSHISQFPQQDHRWVWSRIVDIVQIRNQNAGTITPDNLPEDLLEVFRQKAGKKMPEEFKESSKTDWAQSHYTDVLSLALLVGSWDENNESDVKALTEILGADYDVWSKEKKNILHLADSPVTLNNGVWKVVNRTKLLNLLGSRILDQNLDTFKSLAVRVLREADPAFELPIEQWHFANIYGKVWNHSYALRKGIAEGLALIGSFPEVFNHCSQEKAESTCVLALREILFDADWVRWGSLDRLLPTIAEAAPGGFLGAVEQALDLRLCPYDELFSLEGKDLLGGNYLTGLLWALEGLAWDEQCLVRVCVVLGRLAGHDPGGQWVNRPSNSLATILLPWLPQTLASVDKRKVAVRTLLTECPDVAWKLIIQLLPGQLRIPLYSHKPSWRKVIPDDWEEGVTHGEYLEEVSSYAELAVSAAGYNTSRLSALVDHFGKLPQPALDQLIEILASQPISELAEEQRLPIWDHLRKLINKHRRFSDAEWVLANKWIVRIEALTEQLAPNDPFNLYQHLFNDNDFDLYDEDGDSEGQQKKLIARRKTAISKIFEQQGVEGVICFAESVALPYLVGHTLGMIGEDVFEETFLPHFLDTEDMNHKALVGGFIPGRYYVKNWAWCDSIDKSEWTPAQIGQFLACLPCTKETWGRASEWLQHHENEYWTGVPNYFYQDGDDITIPAEKFLKYGRPHAAIDTMLCSKQPMDTNLCVRVLNAAASSNESDDAMKEYQIVKLIKFLQADPSVNEDDLFQLEWIYLLLLTDDNGAGPQLLERRLANDPEFFCEVIQRIYRSKNTDQPPEEPSEESEAFITMAFRLFGMWKKPPGTQEDGTFSEEHFSDWLRRVKELCTESGHLEVALISIGEVLTYVPADPNGLWIHRAVAAALNDREAEHIRRGFSRGIFDSRGVFYSVDPSGGQERALAAKFRAKAEAVENEGFQRFAVTMKGVADRYERDAVRTIAEESRYIDE